MAPAGIAPLVAADQALAQSDEAAKSTTMTANARARCPSVWIVILICIMKTLAFALLALAGVSALGADVRLGPETPLGPAPQFAAGAQRGVQVALAAGHLLAVWQNSTLTTIDGSLDGMPVSLAASNDL